MNSHLNKLFSFSALRSFSLDVFKQFWTRFKRISLLSEVLTLRTNRVSCYFALCLVYWTIIQNFCLFESQRDNCILPVIDELLKFVHTRCRVLQNSLAPSNLGAPIKTKPNSFIKKGSLFAKTSLVANVAEPQKLCLICHGQHPLYRCDKFLQQQVSAHLKTVQTHRLCRNCISAVHDTFKCSSKYSCLHSSAKHHSLLH